MKKQLILAILAIFLTACGDEGGSFVSFPGDDSGKIDAVFVSDNHFVIPNPNIAKLNYYGNDNSDIIGRINEATIRVNAYYGKSPIENGSDELRADVQNSKGYIYCLTKDSECGIDKGTGLPKSGGGYSDDLKIGQTMVVTGSLKGQPGGEIEIHLYARGVNNAHAEKTISVPIKFPKSEQDITTYVYGPKSKELEELKEGDSVSLIVALTDKEGHLVADARNRLAANKPKCQNTSVTPTDAGLGNGYAKVTCRNLTAGTLVLSVNGMNYAFIVKEKKEEKE